MASKSRRYFTLNILLAGPGLLWAASGQLLLVLGDSISAEYGLPKGTGWVALLEKRLAAEKPTWSVRNASISGETTAGGKTRLPALLKAHRPALVILELGANDALRGLPLKAATQNLQAMIEACQQAGAQVLLLGMQIPPNYGPLYSREFGQMYERLGQKNKLALVPFLLQGLTGPTETAEQWFQADRIHPNARAQPVLLDTVWPQLQKLL